MRSIRSLIIAVLFTIAALPSAAMAQGSQVKVLILPFDMHGTKDISEPRRDIMETAAQALHSMGAEISGIPEIKDLVLEKGVSTFTDETAYELSGRVKADFAVLGSITAVGETTSVDMRLVDLTARTTVAFYYKSSASRPDLVQKIQEAAKQMLEKMTSAIQSRPAVRSGVIDRIMISGNRRVDTAAIMRKLSSREHEQFSADDVKEDIRGIYSTGYFDDVFAELTDSAAGKVLTFRVREMPFIKKITFKGNSELKDEKLGTALTLKENTVLDRVSLMENAAKIKAEYEQEGYYLATVDPVVESDGLEATIVFKINEGPEVRVRGITIIGNKHFTDDEIKDVMGTKETGPFSFVTQSGRFNEFILQNDLALITGLYFDNGYINMEVTDHRVLLSEDKKWFYITIAVSEGDQFSTGDIDVTGDILTTQKELLDKIKVKKGEIFNRSKFSKSLEAISDFYGDKGYAYADVKPVTRVDAVKKTVDATIDIKKNELVYVERIDIGGNVRTRDKVIRRELELEEGSLFSSTAFKTSRNNIRRLGYFEDVKLSQTRGSADDKIKLDVDVKERPTGSLSVGLGYSSVDKLIGTASVSQSNFMGTGVRLDLSGNVSAKSSRYNFGVTEPWLFDKPITAGFDIYNTDRVYPDFKIRKVGFDVSAGFPVSGKQTRGYLTYKLDDVHVSDVADTASNLIKDQEGASTESSVKATLKHDTRDDAFLPTEGSVLTFSTEYAGGLLGGSDDFVRYEADAVRFFPLPWDTTFSVHGGVGYIQGYSAGRKVPVFEKYFLGGINTIRGFDTRSISPKDPVTGDLIGGSSMIVVNAEYMFPLFSKQAFKGVVFFDMGNAFEDRIDVLHLRDGAGFGVRWFSPMGPLRLELGFNLDRRPGERSQSWDFTIGTAF